MKKSFLVINLNPSLDEVIRINELQRGRLNQSESRMVFVGGKGVNLATSMRLADETISVDLLGFLGKENRSFFDKHCQNHGIKNHFIEVKGRTRTNIKILEESSKTETEINESGFGIDETDFNQLWKKLTTLIVKNEMVVINGSLPRGVEVKELQRIIDFCHEKKVPVVLDLRGSLLKRVDLKNIFLIKPNLSEFEELSSPLKTVEEGVLSVLGEGVQHILLSKGAEGLILYSKEKKTYTERRHHGFKLNPLNLNTVGAGDASLAGYLLHYLEDDALAWACAFGASAITTDSPHINTKENPAKILQNSICKKIRDTRGK